MNLGNSEDIFGMVAETLTSEELKSGEEQAAKIIRMRTLRIGGKSAYSFSTFASVSL